MITIRHVIRNNAQDLGLFAVRAYLQLKGIHDQGQFIFVREQPSANTLRDRGDLVGLGYHHHRRGRLQGRKLDETNDRRIFNRPEGVPDWKRRSFDQCVAHGSDPAGHADWSEFIAHVQKKSDRPAQGHRQRHCRSPARRRRREKRCGRRRSGETCCWQDNPTGTEPYESVVILGTFHDEAGEV